MNKAGVQVVDKVISGGQTGADIGGVLAAKLHGLNTSGWLPNGWKTLNGPRPEYADLFQMQEHKDFGYKSRTWANIYDSDATIRLAVNFSSAGEKCTLNGIKAYNKPYWDIQIDKNNPIIIAADVESLADWLINNDFKTINIAGNSHKTWTGMQSYTTKFLSYVFMSMGINRGVLCKKYLSLAELGW